MKIIKIVVAILISVAIIGGVIGAYLHFNPIKKPVEKTEPAWTITTKDYGTFEIEKMYITKTINSKPETISCIVLPNTYIASVKNEIYSNWCWSTGGHSMNLKDYDINNFELVVVPNYDIQTNTQQTTDIVDFKYKEKLDTNLMVRLNTTDDIDKENIVAYTLDSDIMTYTKKFEDITVENKKFTIGIYYKDLNSVFTIAFDGLGKIDNEYYYQISDKNCIFTMAIMNEFIVYEE